MGDKNILAYYLLPLLKEGLQKTTHEPTHTMKMLSQLYANDKRPE